MVGQNDGNSLHSRSKVTIPKEPELETAQRAQRRRYFHLSQLLLHVFYPTRDRSKQCLITWNFVFFLSELKFQVQEQFQVK